MKMPLLSCMYKQQHQRSGQQGNRWKLLMVLLIPSTEWSVCSRCHNLVCKFVSLGHLRRDKYTLPQSLIKMIKILYKVMKNKSTTLSQNFAEQLFYSASSATHTICRALRSYKMAQRIVRIITCSSHLCWGLPIRKKRHEWLSTKNLLPLQTFNLSLTNAFWERQYKRDVKYDRQSATNWYLLSRLKQVKSVTVSPY